MSETIFPTRWAPQHPDRIQLHSLATPNGKKAGIMLEALAVPSDPPQHNFRSQDQFATQFIRINPTPKNPPLIHP